MEHNFFDTLNPERGSSKIIRTTVLKTKEVSEGDRCFFSPSQSTPNSIKRIIERCDEKGERKVKDRDYIEFEIE